MTDKKECKVEKDMQTSKLQGLITRVTELRDTVKTLDYLDKKDVVDESSKILEALNTIKKDTVSKSQNMSYMQSFNITAAYKGNVIDFVTFAHSGASMGTMLTKTLDVEDKWNKIKEAHIATSNGYQQKYDAVIKKTTPMRKRP